MSPYRSLLRWLWLVLAGASVLLWLAGCFRYTSVGLDHNQSSGADGLVTYYRIRWPGEGSLWIGFSSHRVPRAQLSRYPIEPGGRLFDAPVVPPPRSLANRFGFWCVSDVESDPLGALNWPDPVQSRWLAMPGWLPTLLFAGLGWRGRRKRRSPGLETSPKERPAG